MDLERIKQNLRLRSGRNSKPKKNHRPKPTKQEQSLLPNGTAHTFEQPKEEPAQAPAASDGAREQEQSKDFELPSEAQEYHPPEHRPSLTHAGTGLSHKPSRQYGRSGIAIPPQSANSKDAPALQRTMTDPQAHSSDNPDTIDFDLKAPAAKPRPPSVEQLSELLFSAGHLNSILHSPRGVSRFTAFLNKYRPEYQPLILRYLETQKAIKAVAYANAVAEGATVTSTDEDKAVESAIPPLAATLDKKFEEASNDSFTALVGTALPMYITYSLVKLVTECLINEITGNQTPMMRNLVGGLSEVFCITDPNQEDNPIIYASEEFYRLTGYGRDDVIGSNCRFLQGRKTLQESPKRIGESVKKGEDHCETLLNYRRDGRPFINLLLVAPLHDDKGKVKYYIGAQVDVTGLVEDGRALDGFEAYLAFRQRETQNTIANVESDSQKKKKALKKLRELSEMFDLEESAVVQTHSRASSMSRESDSGSVGSTERRRANRRVFVDSDASDQEEGNDDGDDEDKDTWKLGQSGPSGLSGKLPGIYDSYMLIRAAPSLRIIFVSPKLRKIGKVIQSPFMSHVAAPPTTLQGLKESFSTGTPVSAKINFLHESGESRDGTRTSPGQKHEVGKHGRACWISATPLLGSDDRVGVWMIVVVEKKKARKTERAAEVEAKALSKAQSNKPDRIELPKRQYSNRSRPEASEKQNKDMPIKPKRLEDLKEVNYDTPATSARSDKVAEKETPPANHVEPPQPESHENGDDDQFVLTKPDPNEGNSSNDVLDGADIDHEPVQDENNDWHPARSRSGTLEEDQPQRKYTPPPEIPKSMMGATPPPRTPGEFQLKLEDVNVSRNDEDEFDSTPTRTRFDEGENEDTPRRRDPVAAGVSEVDGVDEVDGVNEIEGDEKDDQGDNDDEVDQATLQQPKPDGVKQPNLIDMDYLRHPGSQAVAPKLNNAGKDDDKWTDFDCMRSPYSVD